VAKLLDDYKTLKTAKVVLYLLVTAKIGQLGGMSGLSQ
jgi:hypothetical protein